MSSTTNSPRHVHAKSDGELLGANADVDTYFAEFFVRHRSKVFAFAVASVGHDAADEVTADTFATAWRAHASFTTNGSALPWLLGIAANAVRRERFGQQRWSRKLSRAAEQCDPASVAVGDFTSDPRVTAVLAALDALRPKDKQAVLLQIIGDMSTAEIARSIGTSEGATRVRLARATKRIREICTSAEEGDDNGHA